MKIEFVIYFFLVELFDIIHSLKHIQYVEKSSKIDA